MSKCLLQVNLSIIRSTVQSWDGHRRLGRHCFPQLPWDWTLLITSRKVTEHQPQSLSHPEVISDANNLDFQFTSQGTLRWEFNPFCGTLSFRITFFFMLYLKSFKRERGGFADDPNRVIDLARELASHLLKITERVYSVQKQLIKSGEVCRQWYMFCFLFRQWVFVPLIQFCLCLCNYSWCISNIFV